MLIRALVLFALVATIWWVGRISERALSQRKQDRERLRRAEATRDTTVQSTEQCRACGAYVALRRACGRPDCPYPAA